MLQQEQGKDKIVVVNTNADSFNDDLISLIKIKGFSSSTEIEGNVKRSLLLQQLILSVVEENIGLIATDPEYEPIEVAQELKTRIFDKNVVNFKVLQTQQPEITNISDMLKAG